MARKVGQLYQPSTFYKNLIDRYGSWSEVLRAAGIQNAAHHQLSREELSHIVRELYREGHDINYNSIYLDKTQKIQNFLSERDLFHYSPSLLITNAKRLHGGWDQALKDAGYNPLWIKKRGQVEANIENAEWVGSVLRDLARIVPDIHRVRDILADKNVEKYFEENIKNFKASYFYEIVRTEYGSWNEAVYALGLSPRLPNRKWTREAILETLKDMHEGGLSINARSVNLDITGELRAYLLKNKITGSTSQALYTSAVKIFGGWDQALIAANINPDVVRLRGSTPFHLLREWMKDERRSETNEWLPGQKTYTTNKKGELEVEIVDPRNLESDLISRENQEIIGHRIDTLSINDKQIFTEMVKEIELNGVPKADGVSLARAFAERIAERLGIESELLQLEKKIEHTMATLLKDPSLREALFE